MSEKSDLFARISQCNAEIARIKVDILGMLEEKDISLDFQKIFGKYHSDNEAYDISVNNQWRRELCDEAKKIQNNVALKLQDAIDYKINLNVDLDICIKNALKMIDDLEAEIARCRARIAQIEAEEEAERRRHNS